MEPRPEIAILINRLLYIYTPKFRAFKNMSGQEAAGEDREFTHRVWLFNTLIRICEEFFADERNRSRFVFSPSIVRKTTDQWFYSMHYHAGKFDDEGIFQDNVHGEIFIYFHNVDDHANCFLEVYDTYDFINNDTSFSELVNFDTIEFERKEDEPLIKLLFRIWLNIDRFPKTARDISLQFEEIKRFIARHDDWEIDTVYKSMTDNDTLAVAMADHNRLGEQVHPLHREVLSMPELLSIIRNILKSNSIVDGVKKRFDIPFV